VTSPDELTILHWNVHSWRDEAGRPNHEAVLRLIGQTSPDMVSLVEVSEPWGSPAALGDLARAGGYSWIFFPAVEFGRDAPDRGYGNALLTRVPVLAAVQWRLTWPPRLYDGTEPSESRSVILAEVPFGRGTAWIGSTHLPANDPQARACALSRLRELTRGLDRPWAIFGDFNTPPATVKGDSEEEIGEGRGGGWGAGGGGTAWPDPPQPSFPASDPAEPIDYCVASPGVSVTARILAAAGSDHLPLLARLVTSAG
jgi:endonuclease/exonuclease/phosphatase family metal-dependent hydrolase